MAKYQPQYSPDQKHAIAAAMLDAKCTAPAAIALAMAGELIDRNGQRLEPFELPTGTAYKWAREEHQRREGTGTSALSKATRPDAAKKIVNRVLDMLDRELRELERSARGGRKRDAERAAAHRVTHAERIAKAAEQVLKLERAITDQAKPSTPTGKGEGGTRTRPAPSKEGSALTREARSRQRGPEHDDAPSLTPTPVGGEAPGPGVPGEQQQRGEAHATTHDQSEAA